jgi:hypothetical protein
MTKAELIGLMREVQWAVAYAASGPLVPRDIKELRDRFDAALKDADTPLDVEWRSPENRPTVFLAHRAGADMEVQLGAERWLWDVSLYGDCATEEEAKAMAIKVAERFE